MNTTPKLSQQYRLSLILHLIQLMKCSIISYTTVNFEGESQYWENPWKTQFLKRIPMCFVMWCYKSFLHWRTLTQVFCVVTLRSFLFLVRMLWRSFARSAYDALRQPDFSWRKGMQQGWKPFKDRTQLSREFKKKFLEDFIRVKVGRTPSEPHLGDNF